jgi:hypothetical protein
MEQWEQHPTITAYEASDAAVALRIQQQDATARQDEILLINEPAAKPTDLGPYTFDGQVAVIQRDDAGPIRRIFVFGGTTLTEKASGTVLLDGLNPHTAVEVSYTAEEVKITGNVSNRLRLYAPQVKQLLVNDQPRVYIRTGHYIALMPTPYELFLSLIRR